MKNLYKKLFALALVLTTLPSFGQNMQTQVERTVAQVQLARAARVQLDFEWKKQEYLERRVRFRPGKKIRVAYPAEYKTIRCTGVLLNNSRVATPSSCTEYKDGFELQKVTLTFSNGKKAVGLAQSVRVNGDIAQITVASSVTQGLAGLEPARIAKDRSLQDVYGDKFTSGLQQFLLARGVVSPRAARFNKRKTSLEKGEPFIWNGKLVALFNRVPKRLPVSLFGQISEDFLSVFR